MVFFLNFQKKEGILSKFFLNNFGKEGSLSKQFLNRNIPALTHTVLASARGHVFRVQTLVNMCVNRRISIYIDICELEFHGVQMCEKAKLLGK